MTRVQMKMLMSTAMKAVMGEVPASMWEICVLSVNDKQEAVIRIPKE